MNSLKNVRQKRRDTGDTYASATQSASMLADSLQYRRRRIEASDMIAIGEAAQLMGASRVTISAWIKAGHCIGVSTPRRGVKLPRWQFDVGTWPVFQLLASTLDTVDGWQLLAFMESASMALDGKTPRSALEEGVPVERILAVATAWAH